MTEDTENPEAGSETSPATADTPPDRLSVNPHSDYFEPEVLQRGIGIRLNGVEKTTIEEYCVSEGWVKVAAGKSRDRHGNPMMLTLKGKVEPYFKDAAETD
ncbi:glutathione peroxidase [Pacificimonas flava]|uniref:Glutathione peroxidase n=2 Tax=Pacificimonas TaxID=1960290 RepID=A0A219B269_9SPHN|nr:MULTISPECIES: DUF3297 family protein [Pacificimonas]MBZ6378139.1 DUF3297 family protein [Pacificimonas aurantium]OWV32226.1 glutathione peroxidase [Pacificimonas flava]